MEIKDFGYTIGGGISGKYNRITDVPGVQVGHCTVDDGDVHSGVTVIFPCNDSVYENKPVSAVHVLNGYGKTSGTVQVEELGCIESPIALTNTLSVGNVLDAMTGYIISDENTRGIEVRSVNAVVGETNDSEISNIGKRAIKEQHVIAAIKDAKSHGPEFMEGDVGAGRGTICFGLKGGIGSSSRLVELNGKTYTIGVLVQSNFGETENLTICGNPIGKRIAEYLEVKAVEDKGSIMIVVGTDAPLTSRQLKRVIKRAAVGLVRTGSFMGTGSGDVFIGFSNGNLIGKANKNQISNIEMFPEDRINLLFTATAEATEEAILNSLINGHPAQNRNGKKIHSLCEFINQS